MKPAVAVATFLAATVGATTALAQIEPITVGYRPVRYFLAGLTTGASFATDHNGGYVGLELSNAWLYKGIWAGGYVDGAYDFGQQAPTFSIGPEVGFWVVGMDGGLAARVYDGEFEVGPTLRGLITIGFVGLYYRYSYWPQALRDFRVHQAGLLIKFPFGGAAGLGPSAPDNMGGRGRR